MKRYLDYEMIYQRVEMAGALKAHSGDVYIYNGHFVPISREDAILNVRSLFSPMEQKHLKVNVIRQVLEGIKSDPRFKIDFVDYYEPYFIPLKNCVYNVKTGSCGQAYISRDEKGGKIPCFVPDVVINPQYGEPAAFSYFVDADYVPKEVRDLRVWKDFIRSSFPIESDKSEQLLLEIGGAILSAFQVKAFFLLLGEPDCGKSVICKFFGEIIRPEMAVSHVEAEKMRERFSRASLKVSHLNVASEIDSESFKKTLNTLKVISAGETLLIEEKHEPVHAAQIRCKLLFAGNELPEFRTSSMSAITNRAVILDFPVSIPKALQDPFLLEKLLQSRDSIVSEMIDRLHNLAACNFVFTIPDASAAILRNMGGQDPRAIMAAFVTDFCEFGDYFTHTCRLYEAFVKYCDINLINRNLVSKYHFNQLIYKLNGCGYAGKRRLPDEQNPCATAYGIRLREQVLTLMSDSNPIMLNDASKMLFDPGIRVYGSAAASRVYPNVASMPISGDMNPVINRDIGVVLQDGTTCVQQTDIEGETGKNEKKENEVEKHWNIGTSEQIVDRQIADVSVAPVAEIPDGAESMVNEEDKVGKQAEPTAVETEHGGDPNDIARKMQFLTGSDADILNQGFDPFIKVDGDWEDNINPQTGYPDRAGVYYSKKKKDIIRYPFNKEPDVGKEVEITKN